MVASRAAAQGGAVPCLGNGSEQSGRERSGLELGADDYVTKPFSPR